MKSFRMSYTAPFFIYPNASVDGAEKKMIALNDLNLRDHMMSEEQLYPLL